MAADSAHAIPAQVRQFIAAHIRSIEQLEVLLLLRENHSKSWAVADVLCQIQSSEKSVIDCLEKFRNAGLATISPQGLYGFSTRDSSLTATVSELARAYRERRVSVIECIHK